MSKELEMLRSLVEVDHLRQGQRFESPKTVGQASWVWRATGLDLRRILARLEAAERVCEPLVRAAEIVDQIAELEPENLADALSDGTLDAIDAKQEELNKQRQKYAKESKAALRAYRALDGKGRDDSPSYKDRDAK